MHHVCYGAWKGKDFLFAAKHQMAGGKKLTSAEEEDMATVRDSAFCLTAWKNSLREDVKVEHDDSYMGVGSDWIMSFSFCSYGLA